MGGDDPDQTRATPGELEQVRGRARALEAQLADAQQRFAALVDDLAYGYFVCDLTGTVLSANRCAEQITGYRAEQHPSFIEIILPEDLPRAAADLALVATAPNAGPRVYRIRRADGAIRHVEINTVPVREGGELVAFQGTTRDVTDQRRAEAALLESEQRFRELAELLPGVIYEYDLTGRFTYSNRHALALTGYTPEELARGVTVMQLLEPEAHGAALANMLRLAAGEGPVRGEYQLVCKDGRRIPVEAHSNPVRRDGEVVGVRGLLHDLSAIREAEEAKRRLEAQVLHAQKLESLGILAGGVAHDFNNLLQVILGNVSLALSRPQDPAAQRARLEAIRLAAQHARDLTSQMLAYCGSGPVQVGPLDLNAVISDLASLVTASIPRAVRLTLELAPEAPWIDAEATQIRQVLLNLVTNAAEALGTAPGSITVRTGTLEASGAERAGAGAGDEPPPRRYALLEVSDTGCGMDDETVRRIFDPFYSTKFPGRGLGLAAAFGIVRGHRGTIHVRSAPGEGSRFRVLLPLGTPPALRPEATKPHAAPGLPTGTLLLVDDEAAVLESSGLILEEAGFTVLAAPDGERALDVFTEHQGDIGAVLLDLSMPRRDGLATFLDLRRIAPELPIILSSGYGEQDVAERFRGLSVNAFLKKPYEMAELVQTVQRVLGACGDAPRVASPPGRAPPRLADAFSVGRRFKAEAPSDAGHRGSGATPARGGAGGPRRG